MEGYIYILQNDSLQPGYLKIGQTTRSPQQRASEISIGTGVPSAYKVMYQVKVPDCQEAERLVHGRLAQYRANKNREFFVVDRNTAMQVMDHVAQKKMWQEHSDIAAAREVECQHLQRQILDMRQLESEYQKTMARLQADLRQQASEHQGTIANLQNEIAYLRKGLVAAKASCEAAENELLRFKVAMKKRRWHRFFRQSRLWLSYVLLPWAAACLDFVVRPVARALSGFRSVLRARISDRYERAAVIVATAGFVTLLLIVAACFPFRAIALSLAIVALSAVKQMVDQASAGLTTRKDCGSPSTPKPHVQ